MIHTRILEGDVLELHLVRNTAHRLYGLCDGGDDLTLLLHKLYHIVDKECALVYRNGRGEKSGDVCGYRGDGARVERVVADRAVTVDDGICNVDEEEAVDHRGKEADGYLRYSLLDYKALKSLVILSECRLIFSGKGIAKTEYLDLLNLILIHHQTRVILHLSALLGMPADVSEILVSVNQADYRRGQSRNNDNERCNKAEAGEHDNEGYRTDDRADKREGSVEYADGAHICLSVGILELLIECGIVKGACIEGLCLADKYQFNMVYNKLSRDTGDHGGDLV